MTGKINNFTSDVNISTNPVGAGTPPTSSPEVPANAALATTAPLLPSYAQPSPDLVAVRQEQHARWRLAKLGEAFPECGGYLDRLLERVCDEGSLDDAAFLLSNGANGEKVLRSACERGNSALVHLLLANGVNPNLDGGMVFADVCSRGDALCLKAFLSHGAKVKIQVERRSALGLAAASGDLESVKLLLNHGADANGAGIDIFQTPLFCAAEAPHPISLKKQMIQLLLDHGAKIDGVSISDAESVTVLSHACRSNDVDFVRWLLELGANPDQPTIQSPIHICIREPRDPLRCEILTLLMERARLSPYRAYAFLMTALHECNVTAVELLLAKGVDVNPKGARATVTPLMRAVGSHAIPATIVKKLLDAGADIHAKDDKGQTAMDYLQGADAVEYEDGSHLLLSPGDKDFEKKMKLLARAGFHRIRRGQTEAKDT
jgi:ankyrin repeat protein